MTTYRDALASGASVLIGVLAFCGCARFQPNSVATGYGPQSMIQSVTGKDTSVHYDPAVLKAGTPRTDVQKAFGDPNDTRVAANGLTEDVYAFNPDGSKYVNPQIRPRNVALGFFTMGTSVAVRQARLKMAEKKLTLYTIVYSPDGTIRSVKAERMENAPGGGPAVQPPASAPSNAIE
jgi:hypothetical protein